MSVGRAAVISLRPLWLCALLACGAAESTSAVPDVTVGEVDIPGDDRLQREALLLRSQVALGASDVSLEIARLQQAEQLWQRSRRSEAPESCAKELAAFRAALGRGLVVDRARRAGGVPGTAFRLSDDADLRLALAAEEADRLLRLLAAAEGADRGPLLDDLMVELLELQALRLSALPGVLRFLNPEEALGVVRGPVVAGWLAPPTVG